MTQHKFSILFGTVFSIFAIPFSTLFTSLVLGAVGAIGAYVGTAFMKWIFKKLVKN